MQDTPDRDHDRALARAHLAASLKRRVPTWAVARYVLALDLPLPPRTREQLRDLAADAWWVGNRWMNDDFDRPVPADRQVAACARLFPDLVDYEHVHPDDPDDLRALRRHGLLALGAGQHDTARAALRDFPNVMRLAPAVAPARPGRNGVRKRLRLLARLEDRADRLQDQHRLRNAQMQAKSRLAHRIDPDACDDQTLAFCAYLAARANRRSLFLLGEQSRAQDTISDALLALIGDDGAWAQVALVLPTQPVIERLAPGDRGVLVGVYHAAMADAADALSDLHHHLPERMRDEMVMVKGVDSSRWNAYAGALNTTRSAWLAAVRAAGLDDTLDSYLPGKTPRLIASDVAWMHRLSGRELHEDTRMFRRLARPWDVVRGDAQQGRADVLAAALDADVDAIATGWVGPRAPHDRERPEPEPALVHGIVVGDPQLAHALRKAGVFSGKPFRDHDLPPLRRGVAVTGDRAVPFVERDPSTR